MVGKTLAHFKIVEKIGAGGMGEVYRATDTKLGRDVALKVLPTKVSADPRRRRRFEQEARAVAALNHPHIVTIYSIDEDGGVRFLTMELIRGRSLTEAIPESGFPEKRLFEVALPLTDAVSAAHDLGVIHRDLKPSNLMLAEGDRVKVLDFGLATFVQKDPSAGDSDHTRHATQALTQEGVVMGTTPYMAPEQAEGKAVTVRSDVFSLGIILYEMATGRRPFHGDSDPAILSSILKDVPAPPAHLNPHVAPDVDLIIRRCLEKDPSRRYASARELHDELDRAARSRTAAPIGVRKVSEPGPGTGAAPASSGAPFTHDLFISYAQLDNEAQLSGQEGWVSAFHRSLEVRVGQLLGKKPSIWRDVKPNGEDTSGGPPAGMIPRTALLITVLSPRYVKSEWCTRELREFLAAAAQTGGPKWGSRFRVFKVVKTPTPVDRHPPEIQPLPGYEFFRRDPETGRERELDQIFGPEAQREYWAQLDDLAHDIADLLGMVEEQGVAAVSSGSGTAVPSGTKGCVYLAQTTHDLREEHDSLRRDLQRHGYHILPDRPLPLVESELEAVAREQLERCVLSIHLVGRHYGVVPEGGTTSVLETQVAIAAQVSVHRGSKQILWIPGELDVKEERQREFMEQLRTSSYLHRGSDLLETPFEDLKTVVHQVLSPTKMEPATPPANGTDDGLTRVYLICDSRDQDATVPLADYLFESGLDVTLPVFEGDEAEVREDHEDNLRICDAVLVYYGTGNELWLRRKLREVQKSAGLGRSKMLRAKGIWVAAPETTQKSRLRTREALVMRAPQLFAPEPLQPFLQALTGTE